MIRDAVRTQMLFPVNHMMQAQYLMGIAIVASLGARRLFSNESVEVKYVYSRVPLLRAMGVISQGLAFLTAVGIWEQSACGRFV